MDKIFVDEAVNELHTIQDMLRWSVSRFSAANIWYGHGTDNPWDEAVQLVLPSLYLPLDIPEDMRTARLTSSEKHRIVERVIRRKRAHSGRLSDQQSPVLRPRSFTSMNACWYRARRLVS